MEVTGNEQAESLERRVYLRRLAGYGGKRTTEILGREPGPCEKGITKRKTPAFEEEETTNRINPNLSPESRGRLNSAIGN